MVIAPSGNLSPLSVGNYGKSTRRSTQRLHQANEDKSGLKPGRVWALGALGSLRSKKKNEAEKWRAMHFSSDEEEETWIENSIERETTGVRKRVDDADTATSQE